MSRNDYILIATALRNTRPINPFLLTSSDEYRQWENDLHAIEELCADNNPRFDRVKFRRAAYM